MLWLVNVEVVTVGLKRGCAMPFAISWAWHVPWLPPLRLRLECCDALGLSLNAPAALSQLSDALTMGALAACLHSTAAVAR